MFHTGNGETELLSYGNCCALIATMSELNIAPMPWMDEIDYDHLFGLVSEVSMPYSKWIDMMHKQEAQAASTGWTPYRTYINPSFFEDWCNKNHHPLTTESLFLYSQLLFKGHLSLLNGGDSGEVN